MAALPPKLGVSRWRCDGAIIYPDGDFFFLFILFYFYFSHLFIVFFFYFVYFCFFQLFICLISIFFGIYIYDMICICHEAFKENIMKNISLILTTNR